MINAINPITSVQPDTYPWIPHPGALDRQGAFLEQRV